MTKSRQCEDGECPVAFLCPTRHGDIEYDHWKGLYGLSSARGFDGPECESGLPKVTQLVAPFAIFRYLIVFQFFVQFPISREVSKMTMLRKQKQLEALFMKILEQVRAAVGQVGGEANWEVARGVQMPPA